MKKRLLAFLSLLGIQQHLTAQQKQDLIHAGMQATPGAGGAVGLKTFGVGLADLVAIATLIYIALQALHLIWKWRRQARIDKQRESAGQGLCETDWGNL